MLGADGQVKILFDCLEANKTGFWSSEGGQSSRLAAVSGRLKQVPSTTLSDRSPGMPERSVSPWIAGPRPGPADVNQLFAGPASARLAVSTGVRMDRRGMRQGLVVGEDLINGAATGGVGIQGLVQKGQESKSGGVNALAAVVAGCVGLEQPRVDALGAEAFQVMERTAAQGPAGGFERGVELAEEGGGGKHIYL